MIKFLKKKYKSGGSQYSLKVLNRTAFCFYSNKETNSGWFRIAGKGISWVPEGYPPTFAERIGFSKRVTLFGYRFGKLIS